MVHVCLVYTVIDIIENLEVMFRLREVQLLFWAQSPKAMSRLRQVLR